MDDPVDARLAAAVSHDPRATLAQLSERVGLSTSAVQARLRRLSDDLDREVRALLDPERRAELEANEANIKEVGTHLRELHKAAGGLMLP